jgi:DtxR family transcriptional regulator, Mn-dependent transcriptional regulator
MIHPIKDEILEQLWYRREDGKVAQTAADLGLNGNFEAVRAGLEELRAEGLLRIDPVIELLPPGVERARGIVRRHRLAEVLFSEVLGADLEESEASACEFEHMLSESVVNRVCTFLGHPPKCPHGHPIPQGECCRKFDRKVDPLIGRLSDMEPGREGTIAFIAPASAARLTRLSTLGIAPGSPIRLVQKRPAVVVGCGETTVALEEDIARDIFVRRPA